MIIVKGETCKKAGACKWPCIARQPIEISEYYCGKHGATIIDGVSKLKRGWYSNTVKTEWPAGEPREMILIEGLTFVDYAGEAWPVPSGARIDGASIPRVLWALIGSPFTGLYRRASVPHDYYCNVRTRSWIATHKMFFHGMVADGVDPCEAARLYKAVYLFGPRWDANGNDIKPKCDPNERYL